VVRVLVVDDDEAFLYVVKKHLEASGYEVIPFLDWLGVLEVLESDERIDALVTDLRLPPGTPNGHSLGRMARRKRPQLKVVYMTAYEALLGEVRSAASTVVLKSDDSAAVVAALEHALAS
jgi:CheY-like chemotaxis protein